MAVLAAKRREVFASRQAAYDNYKGKPPFMSIDDEALRGYVEWGFDDLDDATVRLKCRAAQEAALFANSATDTFDRLPELACAVTLGLGEFTNEGFQTIVPLQAERLGRGTLVDFPGRSHFGILEGCVEMADLIRAAFATTA